MISWAIDTCRERGCRIVQLTSDKTRHDAAEFYRALGFVASHEGLNNQYEKLYISLAYNL